jgi:hypothetical protein
MAMRFCGGADENLTRWVPFGSFDPDTMALAGFYDRIAPEGLRVICCNCGLQFDDEDQAVTWPHDDLPSRRRTAVPALPANARPEPRESSR